MSDVHVKSLNVPPIARNKRIYSGNMTITNTQGNNAADIINSIKGLTIEQINALIGKFKVKHGFLILDDNDISFDTGTKEFSITLIPQENPDGTFTESFETWQNGTKLMKDTETISVSVVDDVPSDWHIGYSSNGVLEAKQEPWNTFLDVPICSIRWDGVAAELDDQRRPILATWDKYQLYTWKKDESKILTYPYLISGEDHIKNRAVNQILRLALGELNSGDAKLEIDQGDLTDPTDYIWRYKNSSIDDTTFDALIDNLGLLLRFIGPFKLTNNNASVELKNDKSVEIKDKTVTPAIQITTSPAVDYIPISDVDGNIPLGALKKSMVESCLTGNITSHTHDQYLESSDLSNVVVNDGATSKVATIKVMTDAAYTALGSKDATTLYVIVG